MSRIVQCPKCGAILREPPPGNPYFQCGSCSTTLQAKHATQADLEASKRRMDAEQQKRNSFSDLSSGEISDRIADEFTYTGNGKDAGRFKLRDNTYVISGRHNINEMVLEKGMYSGDSRMAIQQQAQPQERVVVSYMQSPKDNELDMQHLALDTVSGGDYPRGRPAYQETLGAERWSSTREPLSNGNSVPQGQRAQVSSSTYKMSSMGRAESVRSQLRDATRNGSLSVGQMQPQASHLQIHTLSTSESIQGTDHIHLGQPNNGLIARMEADKMASGAARAKLKWQARDPHSVDDDISAPSASLGEIDKEDRISHDQISRDVTKLSQSTTSTEHVEERNSTTLASRRQDRGPLEDQGSGQLVRSESVGSDKTFDMYENPCYVGDYEPSETSSTVDEVENNQGIPCGPHSGEVGLDQGIARTVSRPNLPRSNASSERSAFSEESMSYNSQTEMGSPDNPLDHARMVVGARRHSWDERVSRMGSGQQARPSSVRRQSSQDYGSAPSEILQRATSDSGWNYRVDQRQGSQASLYDSARQQPQPAFRPSQQNNQQHQQWINRYAPAPRSPASQTWSPNGSPRSYYVEPSPVHSLQSRSSFSSRQMSGQGQVPLKQGHYPPLPLPGALPHVSCQHCRVLLAVPVNLPPPKTDTQKLRCGSCYKISIFSVQQAEESACVPISCSSRSDPQLGHSLLAFSPDAQAELTSGYRNTAKPFGVDNSKRSVHSFSSPDLVETAEGPLPRQRSFGNEDVMAADEEIVSRALSKGAELLATTSTYSDIPSPNSPTEYHPRYAGGGPMSANPGYEHRAGDDPNFPKTTRNVHTKGMETTHYNVPNSGGNVTTDDKLSQDVSLLSSDSDSDIIQRTRSVNGSPQLNHTGSRSPTLQEVRSSVQNVDHLSAEQVHEVSRGLNKLKGIFSIKSVFKHANPAGSYRRKVVVNGVPIPDHLVKKAEEQAGPIHPGTYWYDSRAGFWGVAGGQCLGIIPPFIEEFNYPMSRDCAGGRTGILVNGRELHHMDRDKLSRRGLPDTPDMSYRIEIDGRVIEEAMGSELRGLGRLAPSLEQKGRGTGMYVPISIGGAGSRT